MRNTTSSGGRLKNTMRRVLSEPLVHFLAAGALIFFFYAAISDSNGAADENVVVIETRDAKRIVEQFRLTWQRAPSQQELDQLMEQIIREEVFVRQAEALSLDWKDPVIRNRLAQKMDGFLRAAAMVQSPDDETLQVFIQSHKDRYQTPSQISFQQIYLGADVSGSEVQSVLERLKDGVRPDQIGEFSMLPAQVKMLDLARVDRVFGPGMYEAVFAQEDGSWQGPVKSGFGYHVVWVTARQAPNMPDLDALREDVSRDYLESHVRQTVEENYQQMKAGYKILTPNKDELKELLQ